MSNEKYTCFICWESFSLDNKNEKEQVISCCRCLHNDYKYSHIRCLKYWVKNSNGSNKKCNICCTPYTIKNSRAPFTTILKNYWFLAYAYLMFLVFLFIINIITWAKVTVPVVVYIVSPKLNKESNQYKKDNNSQLIFIESTLTQKIIVICQTIMSIFFSIYIGKLLVTYIEKKTNTNYLIGMSPDNQILSIDLNENNDEAVSDDEEKHSLTNNNKMINNLNSILV